MVEVELTKSLSRRSIRITGIVQGVGFRPFVYNLSNRLSLTGLVGNDSAGVFIEVEGPRGVLARFERLVHDEAPPLSEIESISGTWITPQGSASFEIAASRAVESSTIFVSPDVATCDDCWEDTVDPANRRLGYPFTNCTNCGPRYTIIEGVPYDRAVTSMGPFTMCVSCQTEYDDPTDRRFHAQPNACPECGPQASYESESGAGLDDAMYEAASAISRGEIIAIKGLGGYHLACDARNESAVTTLRARKGRDAKPFAVMVAEASAAREVCSVNADEERLLSSAARPIVVMERRPDAEIAASVAPANHTLGVMLAYTPLHRLLVRHLERIDPASRAMIVLTSGNVSDEPIVTSDQIARENFLGRISHGVLSHNRDIVARADDSVVRSAPWGPQIMRRSRGFAPSPVRVRPRTDAAVLACGAQLKNTFTLLRDGQAFVSPHIGDLHSAKTVEAFETAIDHYESLFAIRPDIIAHDLHPQYTSTRYALGRSSAQLIPVQHHEAHIASVMAEAQLEGEVIGIAADGTGLGTDGSIWGGEFFVGGLSCFSRANHFASVPLPGADQATKQPWRMGCVYLQQALGPAFLDLDIPFTRGIDRESWNVLDVMIRKRVQTPLTSSVGRLFDAIAAIAGLVGVNRYEGEAAIELEHQAREVALSSSSADIAGYSMESGSQPINSSELIREMVSDVQSSTPLPLIAFKAHMAIARTMSDEAIRLHHETGFDRVILSGGVFQNQLLTTLIQQDLTRQGLKVFMNRLVPANDGGLSLGQAAIAAARAS